MGIIRGTADVKTRLSEFINRVLYRDERIIISRRGKPIAALISLEDLHRLEALEREEKRGDEPEAAHAIMQAYGGWSARDDLDDLVAEIYADRETASGREVNL